MQLKDFDELVRRDFDNAAVTNAIRQVFKERDELLKALKSVLSLIDENILVRNIDRDWDSQYFTKQGFYLVQTLSEVKQAISTAEGTNP